MSKFFIKRGESGGLNALWVNFGINMRLDEQTAESRFYAKSAKKFKFRQKSEKKTRKS